MSTSFLRLKNMSPWSAILWLTHWLTHDTHTKRLL